MIYARAFFDLQLQFAETVSAISRQPLRLPLLGLEASAAEFYTFYDV